MFLHKAQSNSRDRRDSPIRGNVRRTKGSGPYPTNEWYSRPMVGMMFRQWRNDVAYANDVLLTQNDVFALQTLMWHAVRAILFYLLIGAKRPEFFNFQLCYFPPLKSLTHTANLSKGGIALPWLTAGIAHRG